MIRLIFFVFISVSGTVLTQYLESHRPPFKDDSIWGYFMPPILKRSPVQDVTPMEAMVDLTNKLGVSILQDYSSSKGNFAFSPYGVASVLVILFEGAEGESAWQIQRAVNFPSDKDVIRKGFRDIHRHLRSYFSHEGFLSGISLNKNSSQLKPDYKMILKFYGYDIDLNISSEESNNIDMNEPTKLSENEAMTVTEQQNRENENDIATTISPTSKEEETEEVAETTENVEIAKDNDIKITTKKTPVAENRNAATIPELQATEKGDSLMEELLITTSSPVISQAPESAAQTGSEPEGDRSSSEDEETLSTNVPTEASTMPIEDITTSTESEDVTDIRTITSRPSMGEMQSMNLETTSVPPALGEIRESESKTSSERATEAITTNESDISDATDTPTTDKLAKNIVTTDESTSYTPITDTLGRKGITTDAFTTGAFTTGAFTTDARATDASTTDTPITDTLGRKGITTDAFTTGAFTTGAFTTGAFTTDASATDARATDASTTNTPITDTLGRKGITTDASTSDTPITDTLGRKGITTDEPVTEEPERDEPETEPLESDAPETDAPERDEPETEPLESDAPESDAPERDEPETEPPESDAPERDEPETEPPERDEPETEPPESDAPETEPPESDAPETEPPESDAPETDAPERDEPETEPPESDAPATAAPTTDTPTTDTPITDTLGKDALTTDPLTTDTPTTKAPTTEALVTASRKGKEILVTEVSPKENSAVSENSSITTPELEGNSESTMASGFTTETATSTENETRKSTSVPPNNKELKNEFGCAEGMEHLCTENVNIGKTVTDNPKIEVVVDVTGTKNGTMVQQPIFTTTTPPPKTTPPPMNPNFSSILDKLWQQHMQKIYAMEFFQKLSGKRSNGFGNRKLTRCKRSLIEYLKRPVSPGVSLQLQNGMYDTHISKNPEMYRSLPKLMFLVDGSIDTPVPMMTYTSQFPFGYIPRLHAKALEFPLDDPRYKLLLVLPVERRGLRQLIYDLRNFSVREILKSMKPTRVRATIPPFVVEGFVILTSSLQELGIRDVFDPRKANLSRMSYDPELYVRNVEQSVTVIIKNYVETLDIQTRTTAAKALDEEFEATHPFVYFILDTATSVALMIGQMFDPLNSRIY